MNKRRVTDFFQPIQKSVNEVKDDEPRKENTNSTFIQQQSNSQQTTELLLDKPFHPTKDFIFPKTKIGNRDRACQHQWFENFPWLHYDERYRL